MILTYWEKWFTQIIVLFIKISMDYWNMYILYSGNFDEEFGTVNLMEKVVYRCKEIVQY